MTSEGADPSSMLAEVLCRRREGWSIAARICTQISSVCRERGLTRERWRCHVAGGEREVSAPQELSGRCDRSCRRCQSKFSGRPGCVSLGT